MEINEVQYKILDSLYFVEPFQTILEEANEPEGVVAAELRTLISYRYVQTLVYDEKSKDYIAGAFHDADDMRGYRYLATKEGLLKHNGFR